MPTYDYECSSCEHQVLDIVQSFSEKPLVKCPECGKHKLFRIVTGGILAVVNNIDTLGKLADKNSKEHRGQLDEAAAKKREESPQPEKAWFDKYATATSREINKMSPQQQRRYIMEGNK